MSEAEWDISLYFHTVSENSMFSVISFFILSSADYIWQVIHCAEYDMQIWLPEVKVSIMMKPLFDYLDFVTLIVGLYLNWSRESVWKL